MTSEPRQDHLGDERLDGEEKEGGEGDHDGVHLLEEQL
jgi:hypothetical protein